MVPPERTVITCVAGPTPWRVGPVNRDALAAMVQSLGLDGALGSAARAAVECAPGAECANPVTTEFLSRLPARARRELYPLLGRHPGNISHAAPFRFHGGVELQRLLPELDAAAVATVQRFVYTAGEDLVLSDLTAVCAEFEPEKRMLLQRALNATPAVRLALRVTPDSDAKAIAAWFRRPELGAVVESMARGGGGRIDVADLLPAFARDRINRFPTDAEPEDPRNCFWSALNFARPVPEARLARREVAQAELAARYRPVPLAEAGYGDVITFERDDGALVHAAVKIIGDLYFTRNGYIPARPWALIRLADLQLRYRRGVTKAWRLREP